MVLAALACAPALQPTASGAEVINQESVQGWAFISVSGVPQYDMARLSAQVRGITGLEFVAVNPDPRQPYTLILRKSSDADWSRILDAVGTMVRAYRS
jgi:hypothetical protein